MTAVPLPHRQGSAGWLAARRHLITATDIPVLLGISPYKCERDLADEKLDGVDTESTIAMRAGSALEPFVVDEYTRATGKRVRRFRNMVRHPDIWWAGASPDAAVVGERRLIEIKTTASRSRFADGVPGDVEAQVIWQLGVTGYPWADVAALVGNSDLVIREVKADPATFDNLVALAEDFRRRLESGGPFSRNLARINRDHPRDNGAAILATPDVDQLVRNLVIHRGAIRDLEAKAADLEKAVKAYMGDHAELDGPSYRVTWKTTKDRVEIDWRAIAERVLAGLPDEDRTAVIESFTTQRPGSRPFRLVTDSEEG